MSTAHKLEGSNSILAEAQTIIYGEREATYGAPDKNLKSIADFWNTYIRSAKNIESCLTAEDVCVMMVLLKSARLANQIAHHDSQVDACGYMALLERIQNFNAALADKDVNQLKKKGEENAITVDNRKICTHYSTNYGKCDLADCSCAKYSR